MNSLFKQAWFKFRISPSLGQYSRSRVSGYVFCAGLISVQLLVEEEANEGVQEREEAEEYG